MRIAVKNYAPTFNLWNILNAIFDTKLTKPFVGLCLIACAHYVSCEGNLLYYYVHRKTAVEFPLPLYRQTLKPWRRIFNLQKKLICIDLLGKLLNSIELFITTICWMILYNFPFLLTNAINEKFIRYVFTIICIFVSCWV